MAKVVDTVRTAAIGRERGERRGERERERAVSYTHLMLPTKTLV